MKKPEQVSVDPERNSIFVPGSGNLPMIGLDRAKFDAGQKRASREKVMLERMIRSTWQCTECKQKWPGGHVKAKKDGAAVLFVCPQCSGAVVIVEDALSLAKPPRGKI